MLEHDRRLVLRFIAASVIGLVLLGALIALFNTLTRQDLTGMNKVSEVAIEVTAAGTDTYAYVNDDGLQVSVAGESRLLEDNFAGSDIAISSDGMYITVKYGTVCEIKLLATYETVRKEDCLAGVTWIGNSSSYMFFAGKQEEASDFFDETTTKLTYKDMDSTAALENKDISPYSTIFTAKTSAATYVVFGNFLFGESTACELSESADFLQNCTNIAGEITALSVLEDTLYGSLATKDGGTKVINILNPEETLQLSAALLKTPIVGEDMIIYDESDPTASVFRNVMNGKVVKSFSGLRAHTAIATYYLGNNKILIQAVDGLWEASL